MITLFRPAKDRQRAGYALALRRVQERRASRDFAACWAYLIFVVVLGVAFTFGILIATH